MPGIEPPVWLHGLIIMLYRPRLKGSDAREMSLRENTALSAPWALFRCVVALVLLTLCFAGASADERATQPAGITDGATHLSQDPQVNQACAMIEKRCFTAALEVLRPLVSGHPDTVDAHFLLALAAIGVAEQSTDTPRRNALLDEAIAALRTILIDSPGLVRVRLELARAFFLKGDDQLSRQHFERVLAGKPPAAIAANIQRFLQTLHAHKHWSGYFGFALAPDSNISGTSDDEYSYINGLRFRRDADALAKSGVGVIFWGGGEYKQPWNERCHLVTGLGCVSQGICEQAL